jgi:nucleotide-binding universal stress UspA family protein
LDKIIDEIKEQAQSDRIHVNTSWANGNFIADDVLQFASQTAQELIVLTSILDAIAKPAFLGPHSQKIINASKIPVLAIKKIGITILA